MKSRRPARRARSTALRVAGYAGTTLLVAAAVVVLLIPLLGDGGNGGTAGARGSAGPSPMAPGEPGAPDGPPMPPTGPAPQQHGGTPGPAGPGGGAPAGGQGGGPQIPAQGGGGGLTWCPDGTALYRAAGTGVEVVVSVASSGAIRAEPSLRGGGEPPESQQATVDGGRPHTFHFRGLSPQLVAHVKVTTVSVGVSMQTCYARAAA